ncbi:putative nuclease HARBI1 [Centruroides vittatus]|uniref:putative nuclease HARBI1 n=1 Tax=Centruroides vittatus TaxID=120091 RepID=UPI0035105065
MEQLLSALHFYVAGTFQLVLGDLNDLSQSSACRMINRVSFLIAQISADDIQLPKTESERTQTVSDSQLKIRNIVARWPGSSHDGTIFANNHLCAMFLAGDIPSKYHLGDSGYGCKAYLLTPILNPQSDQEK